MKQLNKEWNTNLMKYWKRNNGYQTLGWHGVGFSSHKFHADISEAGTWVQDDQVMVYLVMF